MLLNLGPVVQYRVNPEQGYNPVEQEILRLAKRDKQPANRDPKKAKRQPVCAIQGGIAVAQIVPGWVEREWLDEPNEKRSPPARETHSHRML